MKKRFFLRPWFISSIIIFFCLCAGLVGWTWYAQAHSVPVPPKVSCGEVDTHGGTMPPYSPDAGKVETCFYQAYQHCAAKTLVLHYMGVDTGDYQTFWPVSQKGTCGIAGVARTYGLVKSANGTSSFSCTSVRKEAGGLHIVGCAPDNADFLVPAPAAK